MPGKGDSLRETRMRKGLTQTDLAAKVGVTQSSISQWENGRKRPSARSVSKLASILGLPEESLDESKSDGQEVWYRRQLVLLEQMEKLLSEMRDIIESRYPNA